MSADATRIDALLAAALRGASVPETVLGPECDAAFIFERIRYHGIAGLLHDAPGGLVRGLEIVAKRVADEAVLLTMWELRHRHLLNEVLAALAASGVVAILLKGTALAYDLYAAPATRARGDSDLLVAPDDLAVTRDVLTSLGFSRPDEVSGASERIALQEIWQRACDGGTLHHIDLHWHTLNSAALDGVLDGAECIAHRMALPRLGGEAFAMDRVRTLIHTCIHRRLNFASPYFVGDLTYYGGDRLIWLSDIDRLARSFGEADWTTFAHLAAEKGVGIACLEGLRSAERSLDTPLPEPVVAVLSATTRRSRPAAYLRANQLGRAWLDLRATRGWKDKLDHVIARSLPTAEFVRAKYPRQAWLPLPLLYVRRMFDLFRARPVHGAKR